MHLRIWLDDGTFSLHLTLKGSHVYSPGLQPRVPQAAGSRAVHELSMKCTATRRVMHARDQRIDPNIVQKSTKENNRQRMNLSLNGNVNAFDLRVRLDDRTFSLHLTLKGSHVYSPGLQPRVP
jgi:hypothetical protein